MRDCPESTSTCNRCDQKGHFARECPRDGAPRVESAAEAYCHWCEKRGHYTRLCPERIEDVKREQSEKEEYQKLYSSQEVIVSDLGDSSFSATKNTKETSFSSVY